MTQFHEKTNIKSNPFITMTESSSAQRLSLYVSRRNKKHLPPINEVMEEYDMNMTDTFFKLLKEKHADIQNRKLRKELIGV